MNIEEVLREKQYDFLRTHKRLGNRIDFLVFGGSAAYGLNGPNSDIDIRGVTSPLRSDILNGGIFLPDEIGPCVNVHAGRFEQYEDSDTDTIIYSTDKYIRLIVNSNPNTIEMLGCLPEHYAHVSEVGQLLLDNKDIFLTKKAFNTFAGYASQQFTRLQNSLCKKATKIDQILQTINVVRRAYEHLEEAFPTFKREMLELYVVDERDNKINTKATNMFFEMMEVDKEKIARELGESTLNNAELRINLSMKGISSDDMKGVMGEVSNIINNFSQHTGHRNNKKDAYHEDKHASHLRRLQITCKKILRDHRIETYCGDDIQELLDIKNGAYRQADGMYKQEFFDMVNREMAELRKLYETCTLPDAPDMTKVRKLIETVNEVALAK